MFCSELISYNNIGELSEDPYQELDAVSLFDPLCCCLWAVFLLALFLPEKKSNDDKKSDDLAEQIAERVVQRIKENVQAGGEGVMEVGEQVITSAAQVLGRAAGQAVVSGLGGVVRRFRRNET